MPSAADRAGIVWLPAVPIGKLKVLAVVSCWFAT